MEFHDIANMWPLLDGFEYEEFVANIKANGLLEDIWLYEGKILDGRNRYSACREAGVEPRFRDYTGDNPVGFAYSMNEARRHMTTDQRKALAYLMLPRLEAEARKRQQQYYGNQHQKVDLAPDDAKCKVVKSAAQVGELVKLSARTVERAKAHFDKHPEQVQAVLHGEMTLPKAQQLAKIEELEQRFAMLDMNVPTPTGTYSCLVVDPPWPIDYILRDVRPNQVDVGYPTMSIDEIAALPIPILAEEDCHLYVWSTHKHIHTALHLVLQRDFTSASPATGQGVACDGTDRQRTCVAADKRSDPTPRADLARAAAAPPARVSALARHSGAERGVNPG